MSVLLVDREFISKVNSKIEIEKKGSNYYSIMSPFQFDDGDQIVISLKLVNDNWVFSDEKNTFRHLSYKIDEKLLYKGGRYELIKKSLSMFDVENWNGELILKIRNNNFGDAFYYFVQCILKISNVNYYSKPRSKNTFTDRFNALFKVNLPFGISHFDWYDLNKDSKGVYKVDCKIDSNNDKESIFVYGITTDSKARDVIISLHQFNTWGVKYYPMGIFEVGRKFTRSVSERFGHVCKETFVGLEENRSKILRRINAHISNV